jgi:hypothetical protein
MSAYVIRTFDVLRGLNVTVVDTSGNNYSDPVEAMNDISSWCGTPSASNPCLIRIMPGIYDIGSTTLQMQEYIDIAGSGQNTTKITGTVSNPASGLVTGADNAELRFLTVENIGGSSDKNAIYNSSASPMLTHVTATASGGSSGPNIAIYNLSSSPAMTNVTAAALGGSNCYGIYNNSSSPVFSNVTVSASGGGPNYGIYNSSSVLTLKDVTIVSNGGGNNYGIYNDSSTVTLIDAVSTVWGGSLNYGLYDDSSTTKVNHSVLSGTDNSVYTDSTSTTLIGNTQLDGAVGSTGTTTCAGVYDSSFTFYASTCP